MVDELVDEADSRVVEHHDGVGALVGDVVDQAVGIVVADGRAVVSFRGPDVAEDEAGVACGIDEWVAVLKVPVQIRAIFVGLSNERVVWRAGEALGDCAGSSAADQGSILRYPRVLNAQVTEEPKVEISVVG